MRKGERRCEWIKATRCTAKGGFGAMEAGSEGAGRECLFTSIEIEFGAKGKGKRGNVIEARRRVVVFGVP